MGQIGMSENKDIYESILSGEDLAVHKLIAGNYMFCSREAMVLAIPAMVESGLIHVVEIINNPFTHLSRIRFSINTGCDIGYRNAGFDNFYVTDFRIGMTSDGPLLKRIKEYNENGRGCIST